MKELLKAAVFAAEKHAKQRRKNEGRTPYINHPLEVAEHLARAGGVTEEGILIAALLHDTIEDTETTPEEIEQLFGKEIMDLVLECTDDKSLEKQERKRLQIVSAPNKSSGAKMIKIADKTCNLRSILEDPPRNWSIARQLEYFQWAEQVVAGLTGINKALDSEVKKILGKGIRTLSEQT